MAHSGVSEEKIRISAKDIVEPTSPLLLDYIRHEKMKCVRCKKMPKSGYYMVCQENAHIVCGKCSILEPIDYPESHCCAPEFLEYGTPVMLHQLIDCSTWACAYKENGCLLELLGKDWEHHVKNCKYEFVQECYFYGCLAKRHVLAEVLPHYINYHDGSVLPLDDDNERLITFNFEEDVCKIKRKLGILRDKNQHYFMFAAQTSNNGLLMWMWDLAGGNPASELKKLKTDKVTHDDKPPPLIYWLTLYVPKEDSDEKTEFNFKGIVQPLSRPCDAIINSIDPRDCYKNCMDNLKIAYSKNWRQAKDIYEWTVKITLEPEPVPELSDLAKEFQDQREFYNSFSLIH